MSRTKTDGQYQSVPSASAATHQITGLPVHVLSRVVGQATHRAMSGQTSGRGRSRQIAHAIAPSGIAHQSGHASAAGSSANGTNSSSPSGRIQHVAGPDVVRPGELVWLEIRTAGQPAGGDVAVQDEVDAEWLLQGVRNEQHERQRNREDRHRQGDGGPARTWQADPHRPIVAVAPQPGRVDGAHRADEAEPHRRVEWRSPPDPASRQGSIWTESTIAWSSVRRCSEVPA